MSSSYVQTAARLLWLAAFAVGCAHAYVRLFMPCVTDKECAPMNGRCFHSRGNDLSPICSCPEGTFYDGARAVCENDAYLSSSEIVVVRRNFSRIFYLEQKGARNLTRGQAQFPARWVCDRINRFCRAQDRGVYYVSLDIDNIDTDDGQDTYLRYSDVMWKCTDGKIFYRKNDDMSTDADLGNGMRPAYENCLTDTELCSAIGTGSPSPSDSGADTTACNCVDGWTGPTCQIRLSMDIARPVQPTRTCAFPSAATCAPQETCFFWERPHGRDPGNPAINHNGWCWCGPGYIPAAADPASLTNDACILAPAIRLYGVPALPYLPRAPSYNLEIDSRTRQYQHYTGQGYRYASVAPYPLLANNTLMRINDTVSDEGGYLWRCDDTKSVWNASLGDCVLTWSADSPASEGNDDLFVFNYASCESPDTFGPTCTWNASVCSETRCFSHGECTGTHQGCACDRGWGGYNCSVRACAPNEIDTPAVIVTIDFEDHTKTPAVLASSRPHVWNTTTERCNCSAYYQGVFCELYTCGNRFAAYHPSNGTCTCVGLWARSNLTGRCTVSLCTEAGTWPADTNPNICAAVQPEQLELAFVPAPFEAPDPDNDTHFIDPPFQWDATNIATFGLSMATPAIASLSSVLSAFVPVLP